MHVSSLLLYDGTLVHRVGWVDNKSYVLCGPETFWIALKTNKARYVTYDRPTPVVTCLTCLSETP